MSDDATLITIGELARCTGLPVRTLRFYSDRGLVPPAGRSDAGYRLYDLDAPPRVELVRTLRELGVDLPTTRRVLERELSVADVAAAHATALEAQIRVLRQRRAVLRAASGRGSSPQEMKLMHKLAQLSKDQRRRIVEEFVHDVFGGLDADPGVVGKMRAASPDLPDDPTDEQVQAWIELAELVADEQFRRRVREMAQRSDADRAASGETADRADPADQMRAANAVAQKAGAAIAAGIDPASADARPTVDELAGMFAELHGREDGPGFRAWLAALLETFSDRRVERDWELLGIINGWPGRPSSAPAWEWLAAGLHTSV
jgi:DNA-binding transcriptional MerR regulator